MYDHELQRQCCKNSQRHVDHFENKNIFSLQLRWRCSFIFGSRIIGYRKGFEPTTYGLPFHGRILKPLIHSGMALSNGYPCRSFSKIRYIKIGLCLG
jgi:hypothetical protein